MQLVVISWCQVLQFVWWTMLLIPTQDLLLTLLQEEMVLPVQTPGVQAHPSDAEGRSPANTQELQLYWDSGSGRAPAPAQRRGGDRLLLSARHGPQCAKQQNFSWNRWTQPIAVSVASLSSFFLVPNLMDFLHNLTSSSHTELVETWWLNLSFSSSYSYTHLELVTPRFGNIYTKLYIQSCRDHQDQPYTRASKGQKWNEIFCLFIHEIIAVYPHDCWFNHC